MSDEEQLDDGLYFNEVLAKVGGAIDNCGYLDERTVEALVKLAASSARRYGVPFERFRAWTEKYAWLGPTSPAQGNGKEGT